MQDLKMEGEEKERVYCADCEHVRWQLYTGTCIKHIGWSLDHPIRPEKIVGNCGIQNMYNDCKYFEKREEKKEVSPREESKLSWWARFKSWF